jgi:hypothetical protein
MSAMRSPPGAIGERYVVQRQIGQGGMGAVWLAVDEVLGREVAVKRVGSFPGGTSPDLLRAQREAKLAALRDTLNASIKRGGAHGDGDVGAHIDAALGVWEKSATAR